MLCAFVFIYLDNQTLFPQHVVKQSRCTKYQTASGACRGTTFPQISKVSDIRWTSVCCLTFKKYLNTETHGLSQHSLLCVCVSAATGLNRRRFITVRVGLKTSSVGPHWLLKRSHRAADRLKEAVGTSANCEREEGKMEGWCRPVNTHRESVNHFDNIFHTKTFIHPKTATFILLH